MRINKLSQAVTAAAVVTAASFGIAALATGNPFSGSISLGATAVGALSAVYQPDRTE